MEPAKKSGIALRSEVVTPAEIVKLAKVIDQSSVSHLFIPDLPFTYDSIEISAACLGVSKGLKVGSGVFRPLELDLDQLVRRLQTLQSISENRYLLGVGTGSPGPDPGQKADALIKRVSEIRENFGDDEEFPESYVAALKIGMARKAAGKCDGILLNFCPADYARNLVGDVRKTFSGKLETACYLKVFFSPSENVALKLAIVEFEKYDTLPQYHKMFERSGLSQAIVIAVRTMNDSSVAFSESLRLTSPVNPSDDELKRYVQSFREAGITLPVVYPYFSPQEDFEFKLETIRRIISALE